MELREFIDAAKHADTPRKRLLWFVDLLEWIGQARPQWQAALFLRALDESEKFPENRQAFARILVSILSETQIVGLLSKTGIPQKSSPLAEVSHRIREIFRGSDFDECDLADWLATTFRDEQDFSWVRSEEVWLRIINLISNGESDKPELRSSLSACLRKALATIATEEADPSLNPVRREVTRMLKGVSPPSDDLLSCLQKVRVSRTSLRERLDQAESDTLEPMAGYLLFRLDKVLERVELLLRLFAGLDREADPILLAQSADHFARALIEDKNVGSPLKLSMKRLARDVTKRTAAAGDRFIARTRAQYLKLLLAGAGGGFITFFTVLGKSWIFWQHIPVFLTGTLVSVNYALSFVAIYLLGFKLVTKQPAIAASALVRVFSRHRNRRKGWRAPIRYAVAVGRSVTAAALTNILAVTVAIVAFHWIYRAFHPGQSFLDPASAHHTLESLNPFQSVTIPSAILTGAILWFSSIVGAWFETRSVSFFKWGSKHAYGLASSISLGLMFGAVPVLGSLIGHSLDVRHSTLSTGALILSVCSLGVHASWASGLLRACLGIGAIIILNLGVAFLLGFLVSARVLDLECSIVLRSLEELT